MRALAELVNTYGVACRRLGAATTVAEVTEHANAVGAAYAELMGALAKVVEPE